ncbi:MAG: L-threonylcarbamoyladenylate synthase [Steroidobacteraceae bacterium]|jgi:L-threonylcarbamoyladenylate synthase|nr:L-threonylcarbamoyladenylate synthase [Steroidobacteraceae bacterium]
MPPVRRATQKELEEAVTALRNGDLVAFPTETVYGLGANARDAGALRRVFEAKGRPADHPLILHLDSVRFLPRWVAEVPPQVEPLARAFWPGPLTLVLPRSEEAPDVLTGGQDTIAIRIPSHPMAQQLLTAFGGGIAAPSANRYGRVSPTRPEHVREELGDAVAVILDGGESSIGVESTILSLAGERPRLLRPGSVTQAQLEAVIGPVEVGAGKGSPRVPGSTAQHYSPQTAVAIVPSTLLESRIDTLLRDARRVAVLAQRPPRKAQQGVTWINAGRRLDAYQHDLYANLRSLDKAGADLILVEEVPSQPDWAAVRDRLTRAAVNPR